MTQNIPPKYKIQGIDTKWINLRKNHPKYLQIKFATIWNCSFGEEDENVIVDGRRTDDGRTTTDNQ